MDSQVDDFMSPPVGSTPELFAPGIISTGHHEHSSAIFSIDMSQIFFTIADNSQHVICEMSQTSNGWSKPEVAEFSGTYSDDRPFFSGDGSKLYFESKRPYPGSSEGGKWGIWYVEMENDQCSEAVFDSVFTSWGIETPSMSANNNLYFASTTNEGERNIDIYISRYIGGKYAAPQNLGNSVNSQYMDAYIHISPDESYILFSSFGRPEGTGLFISTKDGNSNWQPAQFISELSSNNDERFIKVSPDGDYIFFNRQFDKYGVESKSKLSILDFNKRLNSPQNGNGDVYWVSSTILDKYR